MIINPTIYGGEENELPASGFSPDTSSKHVSKQLRRTDILVERRLEVSFNSEGVALL